MPRIKYARHFHKQVGNLSQEQQDKLTVKLRLFQKDPFQSALKTHPLKGGLQGTYAFTISHDLRVIFFWEDSSHTTAILLAIGTHDRLYRGTNR